MIGLYYPHEENLANLQSDRSRIPLYNKKNRIDSFLKCKANVWLLIEDFDIKALLWAKFSPLARYQVDRRSVWKRSISDGWIKSLNFAIGEWEILFHFVRQGFLFGRLGF